MACEARQLWTYNAGDSNTVPSPMDDFGWMGQNASPAAGNLSFPVENDLGLGFNAWQLADQSRALSNPVFTGSLSASDADELLAAGWRLSFTSRYVFDFGDQANQGVSVALDGRSYEALFDLDGSGDLQVTLNSGVGLTHVLTTGGLGPTAYHDFELAYSPVAQTTAFSFNGSLVNSWNGASTLATDSVAWGNFGGDQRGVMNFHSLSLDTGEPVDRAGDYNGDGRVNGLDFRQWQALYGSTVDVLGAGADGNGNGIIDAADYTVWRDHFGDGIEALLGDYNGDAVVDAADYTVWRDSVGAMGPGLAADGDEDLEVGASDYRVWKANYGAVAQPGVAALSEPVPEPTTLLLAVLAMGLVGPRRGSCGRRACWGGARKVLQATAFFLRDSLSQPWTSA